MTTTPKPSIAPELKPLLDAAFKTHAPNTVQVFQDLPDHVKENAKLTGVADVLVYKAFDHANPGLAPLAIHLIQTGWAEPGELIAKYAAVAGYQCEMALLSVAKVQNDLNQHMAGFGFDEKVSIKNTPLEGLFELSKQILIKATPEVREEARKALFDAVPTAKTTLFDEQPAVRSVSRPRP